jgi:transcriptional regulator with XRE-family HTH domain
VGKTEQKKQCLLATDLHRRLLAAMEGATQVEIVDKSGVDRGTVAKILANKPEKPFHFANAEKVLEAYGVLFEDKEILDASIGSISSNLTSLPIADSPFLTVEAEELLSKVTGREALLRQIFEELAKGSSRSIVGEALVGKTWLLKQIRDRGNLQNNIGVDLFVYLDLRIVNPGQFFPTLCDLLGVQPPLRGFDLKRKLTGKKYVLCLDEVDQLTDAECFSRKDRDQLCGMCNGKDSELSLLVASQTALHILFPDEPHRSSPLVGLCPTLDIRPIPLAQSQVFITNILNNLEIKFTDQQIMQLHNKSLGRPKDLLDLAHQHYQKSANIRG